MSIYLNLSFGIQSYSYLLSKICVLQFSSRSFYSLISIDINFIEKQKYCDGCLMRILARSRLTISRSGEKKKIKFAC
jgi:hypothetical protein